MFSGVRRFLGRLWSHKKGNTYAIIAAALIPITAMIGSGVDIGRAYMAKNRLQNACDAGSLAARRVMKNDALTDDVVAVGKQFFNFNFPQNAYQTDSFEPSVTRPDTGIVRITASTNIPTAIMRFFGIDSLPLNADCDASLNFINTDVVLVLDVTGSMGDSVSGTVKLQALKDAVMALYDELAPTQAQLEAQGLRLRYGVVPYSSTVNVGRLLYAQNAAYIRDSTPYQTRVANYSAAPAPDTDSGWDYTSNSVSASSCQNWVEANTANGGGPAPTATTVTSYKGSWNNSSYSQSTNWGWSGASDTSGSSRSCRRWRTIVTTKYPEFSNWTYKQATLDTSNYKTPTGTITLATVAPTNLMAAGQYNLPALAATNGPGLSTTGAISWNGCIEERDTVNTITSSSGYTVPSGAHDLLINEIPSSDATRWRPMLPNAIYKRSSGSTSTTNNSRTSTSDWMMNYTPSQGYTACPTESRRLQTWTRSNLDSYITGLQAVGGTYHDIGMIWGARLISTGGVFADGCTNYNGMPCNRHIIFMTDGAQTAYCNVYTTYGIEQNDMRTTGSGSCPSQLSRHEQRFKMACNAAKNLNTSVWVVAFDTSLNANLIDCASNPDQATTSSNGADLIAEFRQIGNKIGALRLVE